MSHDWVPSNLGHGETMRSKCFITNREAAVLGVTTCGIIENEEPSPLVCPVTGMVCLTEQDEFCEDYGCARKAGIDVDRLL